jgi:tetratricopeptide (TPR) repeat protein
MGEPPDLIFQIECGTVKFFPRDLERVSIPKAFYAIDPHYNSHWHKYYLGVFDTVFVSFAQYLDEYRAINPNTHHLPHAHDADSYHEFPGMRDLDVVFVGHVDPECRPQRSRLLDALKDRFSVTIRSGIWNEEVAKLYSRAKIVFNDNDQGVLNPRNFEAMACGALLVTNPAVGLEELFEDRRDLVVYHDVDELVRLVDHYLKADAERERIAVGGRERTGARHSWRTRIKTCYAELERLIESRPAGEPTTPLQRRGPDLLGELALVYYHRELPGDAIKLFEELLTHKPDDPETICNMGLVYADSGFPQQAQWFLGRCLSIDPHHQKALNGLGNLFYDARQWDRAAALYAQALQEEPDCDVALHLALCLSKMGKEAQAEVLARKILREAPNHPYAAKILEQVSGSR